MNSNGNKNQLHKSFFIWINVCGLCFLLLIQWKKYSAVIFNIMAANSHCWPHIYGDLRFPQRSMSIWLIMQIKLTINQRNSHNTSPDQCQLVWPTLVVFIFLGCDILLLCFVLLFSAQDNHRSCVSISSMECAIRCQAPRIKSVMRCLFWNTTR